MLYRKWTRLRVELNFAFEFLPKKCLYLSRSKLQLFDPTKDLIAFSDLLKIRIDRLEK